MFIFLVHLENFEITEIVSKKVLDYFSCVFINKCGNFISKRKFTNKIK